MSLKTYVLLPHTEARANVYLRVNKNERVRLTKRPVDHAYNQITFRDKEGNQRTIRLKLGCPEIDLHKQIKEYMIPANEKYTQAERDALRFENAMLMTEDELVQKYLETSPQYDKFWDKGKDGKGKTGSCVSIKQPLYKLYDKAAEVNEDDRLFNKRVDCAVKIRELKTREDAAALLVRINGSSFRIPSELAECKQLLRDYLDDADEEMMDGLLKTDDTIDEKVTVLIGKAIDKGVISFDKVANYVVKIRDNRTINLREISSSYSQPERERLFREFLISKEGRSMMNDLTKEVDGDDNKDSKNKKTDSKDEGDK